MVVLTYCDVNNTLHTISNDVYKSLTGFFENSSYMEHFKSGDLNKIGIVLFEYADLPYEFNIGFQITLECLGHIYSYDEFVEFLRK